MDLFLLIPGIIFSIAFLAVLVLFARKIPQLRVLDVSTIREEREKQLKEKIILERFERLRKEKLGGVAKAASSVWNGLSKVGRRLVQRLYRVEQYYQRLRQPSDAGADPNAVKRLLEQAADFVRQDELIQAEKLYIEVISHHPKNVDAYEGLGNLYVRNRQHEQARETLKFALRLDAKNASVLMSLGQLEVADGQKKEALEHLRGAVDLRPKNPKYLDAYVEAALAVENAVDAKRGIGLLKEVNPDNQNIEDFQARLKDLKGTG